MLIYFTIIYDSRVYMELNTECFKWSDESCKMAGDGCMNELFVEEGRD